MEPVADRHSADPRVALPRTFAHQRNPTLIPGFIVGALALLGIVLFIVPGLVTIARLEIPLAPRVGMIALAVVAFLAMPLFMLANLLPREMDLRRRRDPRLDVTDQGLRYRDPDRALLVLALVPGVELTAVAWRDRAARRSLPLDPRRRRA